jgi:hypothetical protein
VMVSGREAARILRDVLSSDEQARILLRTGIAGTGTVTPHGTFFERQAVDALRLRPAVDRSEVERLCPHGLLIARLPRDCDLQLGCSWSETADQIRHSMARQRPMTTLTAALMGARMVAWGRLPFVATMLGYVVLTADLIGLDEDGPRLAPPGDWAGALEERRFHTPRGGRPCHLWTPAGLH